MSKAKKEDQQYDRQYEDCAWPGKGEIAAVLVMDSGKGLLDNPGFLERLAKYEGVHFLLRSKRKMNDPVFDLPWTCLLPNREDLTKLVGQELPPSQTFIRVVGNGFALHPDLIEWLNKLSARFDQRTVLVKLDKEGAVLSYKGDTITVLALGRENSGELPGIGAGSVLMATLGAELAKTCPADLTEDLMIDACDLSVNRATRFCITSANFDKEDSKWCGANTRFELGPRCTRRGEPRSLAEIQNEQVRARSYDMILQHKTISLYHADWYLDGFLTVDTKLGLEILTLKSRIQEYFAASDYDDLGKRPFIAALCGQPGSGKSHLADRLGAAVENCKVVNSNATQWTSVEDLFAVFEQIRTIRVGGAHALVFIDEVDAGLRGEPLYGKLLDPLGVGTYVLRGEKRRLGPVVFLIAGSNAPWDSRKKLREASNPEQLEYHDRDRKLPDLVSRVRVILDMPPLLMEKRKTDALYMAAQALLKKFPGLQHVQKGVLKLLCDSTLLHGPRSIAHVVEMFGPLRDSTVVATSDLRVDVEDLELHLVSPARHWERDTELVAITS